MKAWLDLLPIVAFFIAYKTHGVYTAAVVLMVAVVALYAVVWLRERRLETSQWITLAATVGFGGLTLALHDERFLQWKAPAINLVLALIFFVSQFVGQRPLIARMLGEAVSLTPAQWRTLNLGWVGFFLFCAAAHAFVVLHYPQYWVDFKLFGSLALTFLFIIAQGVWLVRQGAIKHTGA